MATPNMPPRPAARAVSARPPGYFDRNQLFASVALLFWYVLRLYLSRRD
jgi:hypothetical protein